SFGGGMAWRMDYGWGWGGPWDMSWNMGKGFGKGQGKGYGKGGSGSKPKPPTLPDTVVIDETQRYTGTVTIYNKFKGFGFVELAQKEVVPGDKESNGKCGAADRPWSSASLRRRLFGGEDSQLTLEEVRFCVRKSKCPPDRSCVWNRKWLQERFVGERGYDLVRLREALELFSVKGALIFNFHFCQGSPPDSLAKLRALHEAGGPDVLIVPLLSWYSSSWDREPELPWEPDVDMPWMDFRACSWPQELTNEVRAREGDFKFGQEGTSRGISEVFAAVNEPWLSLISCRRDPSQQVVISFSHFLPRQEIFAEKRFLIESRLPKVSGSEALEEQVKRLKSDIHVFGHTHLTVDHVVDGQRFVQWALGSPSEQKSGVSRAVSQTGMLVLFDGAAEPGVVPQQETFWGNYFR
ncbi:unnamed protein product, partial [Polarella glacialis]